MTGRCTFEPLTPERLSDVARVFNDCGEASPCWCAYWYRPNAEFRAGLGEANRRFFRRLVRQGPPPGILAYVGDRPAAWCSVAPRQTFHRLTHMRGLEDLDDSAIWSINCFVVAKAYRRQGLLRRLIHGAVAHAWREGAKTVEGYPVDGAKRKRPGSADLYTGTLTAFLDEGFVEVARRAAARPIVRKTLA